MRGEASYRSKKPGPRPTACIWCGSTECTHCRCSGQIGCNHKKGEMCQNARYKRRLVCNSCEKNKLREKRQNSMSSSTKKKKAKRASKVSRKRELSKAVNNSNQTTATDSPEKKEIDQTQSVLPTTYNIRITLSNTGEVIGVLPIEKLDIPLLTIRSSVDWYLSSHFRGSNFYFVKDKSLVTLETESHLSVAQICINQNNIYSIYIHRVDNQAFPSLSTFPYHPSYQSVSVLPQPRPSPTYIPTQTAAFSNEPVNYFNEPAPLNETPLQRALREAKASGKIDEIISQPMTTILDFGMDDAPREMVSRNSSFFPFGSWENMYSGNGSMIFSMSRPGSIVINPAGSNLSMDFKDSNFAYEDILNKLRERDYDDTDKGAPSV